MRRTDRLAFGPPCRGRGGVHHAPLTRTAVLAFGPSCRGRGGVHRTPFETHRSSRFRPSQPRPRRRSLRPLQTNRSSRFRPSLPGPRRSLRPLETNLSSLGPPCRGRGGVRCAPLRRTSRLGLPVTGIASVGCLLSVLLPARPPRGRTLASPRSCRVEPVSLALKVEAWTVPSSPTSTLAATSPVTADTASSFDVEHT